jgi:hypothetical protein
MLHMRKARQLADAALRVTAFDQKVGAAEIGAR